MAMPKKIAGVKAPVAIAALAILVVGVLYLRHRANVAASTSSAGPAASTVDSGLGSGGSGAVSTPTDNGLGSTAVGTEGVQSSDLWNSLLSAYQISSSANADLAAHAGTYTNYVTSTSYYGANGSSGGGYVRPTTYNDLGVSPTPITSSMVAAPKFSPGGYPNPYSPGNTLDAALHPGVYSQTVVGASTAKLA